MMIPSRFKSGLNLQGVQFEGQRLDAFGCSGSLGPPYVALKPCPAELGGSQLSGALRCLSFLIVGLVGSTKPQVKILRQGI